MKEHEAEEREAEEEAAESPALAAGLADALVLGHGAAEGARETGAYLAAQTRLLGVQLEHMHEQRMLQLEHLRVRRWRERLQLSLQLLLWAGAALIAAGVIWLAVWTIRDDGLVILPLKAAPPLAAQGLDGAVLAERLLDGVRRLQEDTQTARAPSTLKNVGAEEIKVEIPETGVSIGELMKLLRGWLGHETQITGEVSKAPTSS